MLHAPLRVLVYANPDVSALGEDLDRLLSRLIALLGAARSSELNGDAAARG